MSRIKDIAEAWCNFSFGVFWWCASLAALAYVLRALNEFWI